MFSTSACCSLVRLAKSISKKLRAFCTAASCLASRLAVSKLANTLALLIIACCLLSKFFIVIVWKNEASFSATPNTASIIALDIAAVCAVPVIPLNAIVRDTSRDKLCAHGGIIGSPLEFLNSADIISICPRIVALLSV